MSLTMKRKKLLDTEVEEELQDVVDPQETLAADLLPHPQEVGTSQEDHPMVEAPDLHQDLDHPTNLVVLLIPIKLSDLPALRDPADSMIPTDLVDLIIPADLVDLLAPRVSVDLTIPVDPSTHLALRDPADPMIPTDLVDLTIPADPSTHLAPRLPPDPMTLVDLKDLPALRDPPDLLTPMLPADPMVSMDLQELMTSVDLRDLPAPRASVHLSTPQEPRDPVAPADLPVSSNPELFVSPASPRDSIKDAPINHLALREVTESKEPDSESDIIETNQSDIMFKL